MRILRKIFRSQIGNLNIAKERLIEKRINYIAKMNERGWEVYGHEYSSNHEYIITMRQTNKFNEVK